MKTKVHQLQRESKTEFYCNYQSSKVSVFDSINHILDEFSWNYSITIRRTSDGYYTTNR